MRRKEVLFAVIGGVVGAVLVMVAGQLSPRVGRIACTDLEVVDSKGNPRVRLSAGEYGGRVQVLGDGVDAAIFTQRHAAVVSVRDGDRGASMGIAGEDVSVTVSGGIPPLPRMRTDEHGRRVAVYAEDDIPKAKMGIGKHGGYVFVDGSSEDYRSKAMMYIAPSLGGGISTWDKNGNRLAELK